LNAVDNGTSQNGNGGKGGIAIDGTANGGRAVTIILITAATKNLVTVATVA
jgi:hypothetical protein